MAAVNDRREGTASKKSPTETNGCILEKIQSRLSFHDDLIKRVYYFSFHYFNGIYPMKHCLTSYCYLRFNNVLVPRNAIMYTENTTTTSFIIEALFY